VDIDDTLFLGISLGLAGLLLLFFTALTGCSREHLGLLVGISFATADWITDVLYIVTEKFFAEWILIACIASISLTFAAYLLWLARLGIRLDPHRLATLPRLSAMVLLLPLWLVVGFVLHLSLGFSFFTIEHRFKSLFGQQLDSPRLKRAKSYDALVDLPYYNRHRLIEVLIESTPQFALQLANTVLTGRTTPIAVASLAASALNILGLLYAVCFQVVVLQQDFETIRPTLGFEQSKKTLVEDGAVAVDAAEPGADDEEPGADADADADAGAGADARAGAKRASSRAAPGMALEAGAPTASDRP